MSSSPVLVSPIVPKISWPRSKWKRGLWSENDQIIVVIFWSVIHKTFLFETNAIGHRVNIENFRGIFHKQLRCTDPNCLSYNIAWYLYHNHKPVGFLHLAKFVASCRQTNTKEGISRQQEKQHWVRCNESRTWYRNVWTCWINQCEELCISFLGG